MMFAADPNLVSPQVAPPPPPFVDVATLLQSSQPRNRGGWFWYSAGIFMLVVLGSAIARNQSGLMARAMSALSALAMVGVIAAMLFITLLAVRRMRGEQQRLESAEELVQLRRGRRRRRCCRVCWCDRRVRR